MKSCVSNNVLPIPREIYFSGFAVSTPRFFFTQSPTEKKPKRCVSRNDQKAFHIPENHGSQISLCLLRFVFSWIQRRETAKKPILSHLGFVIELKLAGFSRVSHMGHRIGFQIGISLGIATTLGRFGVEAAIDSIQFLRFNRQVDTSM